MTAAQPLLPVEAAIAAMVAAVQPLQQTQAVALIAALDWVLAAPIIAPLNVPPHANAAMDGYALRCSDLAAAGDSGLQINQRISAGEQGIALAPGCAARIFTGAPIPPGSDAVMMQELCQVSAGQLRLERPPRPLENIRSIGEDIAAGSVLIAAGTRLEPAHLGLLASVGIAQVLVWRKPRVALLTTGNELRMPGQALAAGQIYNANYFVLRPALERLGCIVSDCGVVADNRLATEQALTGAARDHDLIISCGGVSVGDEDHIKPAVQACGRLDLWRLGIKPGKPLAFGCVHRADGSAAHFVGLPGNPVSAIITLLIVVRPLLAKLAGTSAEPLLSLPMRADFAWPQRDLRREFLRVKMNPQGGLALHPNQGSGVLSSVAWADGLVDNPPGQTIAPGDMVNYLPLQLLLR